MVTKIVLRISVFMPCFLASFRRASCNDWSFFKSSGILVVLYLLEVPTKLSFHEAPTSHHLPFVSTLRISSKLTRNASVLRTVRFLDNPFRNFFIFETISLSPCPPAVWLFLILLFFTLAIVSSMNLWRVLKNVLLCVWAWFLVHDSLLTI